LTGEKRIWGADYLDLNWINFSSPASFNCFGDALDQPMWHVEHYSIRIEDSRRERCSVKHQMGEMSEEERVLQAGWLPFGSVGDHHSPASLTFTHSPPLGADGEPGSSMAAQPTYVELVEQFPLGSA
jgi:hypothetical protein